MTQKYPDTQCKHKGCKEHALSLSDSCWAHLSDKKGHAAKLLDIAVNKQNLKGLNMKRVSFDGATLLGVDFSESDLSMASLSGASLYDSDFTGANLVGVNFTDADLTNSVFTRADLAKSNFTNARLWNGDFTGSNLSESTLHNADLSNTLFYDTKFWHTLFLGSRFLTKRNFSKKNKRAPFFEDAKISEEGLFSAEESYRDIKNYFLYNGMYNDASWASFKEKAMERLILKKNRNPGYFVSMLMNLLCGYGERPSRIILSAILTISLYAAAFFLTGGIENTVYIGEDLSFADYLYYSAITFTTVGYGDFLPKPASFFRILAASEAFFGTFLTGLFIFTLARRYSAR
ncbi:MAG: pentapeptide repeat-containing protein [Candidatus Omnitrophota bacterium]